LGVNARPFSGGSGGSGGSGSTAAAAAEVAVFEWAYTKNMCHTKTNVQHR
jgi:hypothetical protein